MELSSEAQASSQCWQQRIQAQVPRAPWGDAGRSAPAEPPTQTPPPLQTPPAVLYSPRMGRPGGLLSASRAPGEGKSGQDVPHSLFPLPPILPCCRYLLGVPRSPPTASASPWGPAASSTCRGWSGQGGTGGTSLSLLPCTPLCVSINLTHHCLPSSPRVSAPSYFPSPCPHTSATPQVRPQSHNPPNNPKLTTPLYPRVCVPHGLPPAPTRVRVQAPAHRGHAPHVPTPPMYTRTPPINAPPVSAAPRPRSRARHSARGGGSRAPEPRHGGTPAPAQSGSPGIRSRRPRP